MQEIIAIIKLRALERTTQEKEKGHSRMLCRLPVRQVAHEEIREL